MKLFLTARGEHGLGFKSCGFLFFMMDLNFIISAFPDMDWME